MGLCFLVQNGENRSQNGEKKQTPFIDDTTAQMKLPTKKYKLDNHNEE